MTLNVIHRYHWYPHLFPDLLRLPQPHIQAHFLSRPHCHRNCSQPLIPPLLDPNLFHCPLNNYGQVFLMHLFRHTRLHPIEFIPLFPLRDLMIAFDLSEAVDYRCGTLIE
jgi:hypothetical protein